MKFNAAATHGAHGYKMSPYHFSLLKFLNIFFNILNIFFESLLYIQRKLWFEVMELARQTVINSAARDSNPVVIHVCDKWWPD